MVAARAHVPALLVSPSVLMISGRPLISLTRFLLQPGAAKVYLHRYWQLAVGVLFGWFA